MPTSKRPIRADDLHKIHYVQDPQISPDGRFVAFVKVTPDPSEKSYKRNIWLLPLPHGEAFQLTRGDKDEQPRWSPDSSQLAFVSGRGDKPQIFLLPTAAPGGEARALTAMENGAHNPDWSPDGARIAFLAPMSEDERAKDDAGDAPPQPKDKLEGKQRKERKAEDELKRWDPRSMWRIPYRQGTSFVDERYNQIYVIDAAESAESKAKRLTDLSANYSQPRWSPDGGSLYSDRTTIPDGDEPWRERNIFRLDAATGEEVALTQGEYSAYAPYPSPDGKWIAYGRGHIGITDMPERLVVMATDGSVDRVINDSLDREVFDLAWSPDSQLTLSIESEGNLQPWIYDPESDGLSQAHDGRYEIEQISAGVDGVMAMSLSTPGNPQELYVLAGGELREATRFNHEWLDKVIVQEVQELRFNSLHGAVQGWYLLPVDYIPSP